MRSVREILQKVRNKNVQKVKNKISFDSRTQKIIQCKLTLFIIFVQSSFIVIFLAFVDYIPKKHSSDPRHSVGPVFGGFCQYVNMRCIQTNSECLFDSFT